MSGIPPPPPSAAPPAPKMNPLVATSSGGKPDFLADIRKGNQLKKVPDTLKNHRTGLNTSGAVENKVGAASSNDIRSQLSSMFGGEAPKLKSKAANNLSSKCVLPPVDVKSSFDQPRSPLSQSGSQVTPAFQTSPPSKKKPAPQRPPSHSSPKTTTSFDLTSDRNSSISMPSRQPPPTPIRSSATITFEDRFIFPKEASFPSPPLVLTGARTYVKHRPNKR